MSLRTGLNSFFYDFVHVFGRYGGWNNLVIFLGDTNMVYIIFNYAFFLLDPILHLCGGKFSISLSAMLNHYHVICVKYKILLHCCRYFIL